MWFSIETNILYKGNLKVLSALRQGYANTEDSLGKSVLLISNMSEEAGAASFPAEAKLKAALRLLFTKQPAWVSMCEDEGALSRTGPPPLNYERLRMLKTTHY